MSRPPPPPPSPRPSSSLVSTLDVHSSSSSLPSHSNLTYFDCEEVLSDEQMECMIKMYLSPFASNYRSGCYSPDFSDILTYGEGDLMVDIGDVSAIEEEDPLQDPLSDRVDEGEVTTEEESAAPLSLSPSSPERAPRIKDRRGGKTQDTLDTISVDESTDSTRTRQRKEQEVEQPQETRKEQTKRKPSSDSIDEMCESNEEREWRDVRSVTDTRVHTHKQSTTPTKKTTKRSLIVSPAGARIKEIVSREPPPCKKAKVWEGEGKEVCRVVDDYHGGHSTLSHYSSEDTSSFIAHSHNETREETVRVILAPPPQSCDGQIHYPLNRPHQLSLSSSSNHLGSPLVSMPFFNWSFSAAVADPTYLELKDDISEPTYTELTTVSTVSTVHMNGFSSTDDKLDYVSPPSYNYDSYTPPPEIDEIYEHPLYGSDYVYL